MQASLDYIKPVLGLISHWILLCRPSTKWWALWSWWRWTRTVWHQSRGWTRSSAKWIRTTTTRSRWTSSKRQRRATRPSCSCCSVTCRSEPRQPPSRAPLPVCNPHTLDSSTRFNVSLGFLPFPQEKILIIQCLDYFSMDLLLVVVCMRMSNAKYFWI